jgi:hypothetical protein
MNAGLSGNNLNTIRPFHSLLLADPTDRPSVSGHGQTDFLNVRQISDNTLIFRSRRLSFVTKTTLYPVDDEKERVAV